MKVASIIILPKNMLKTSEIFLLTLLLSAVLAQSCVSTPDPSLLIQAGTIQITNPYLSGPPSPIRKHSYAVPIQYIVPSSGFQVAASIKAWDFTSFFANQWDFSVRGGLGATPSSAEIVLFISDDNTWTSLQVSYLISSRSDLFLGSFIADGFIFQDDASNQLTLSYSIPNWQSTPNEVISTAEFAGIRTFLSQPLAIVFTSTNVDAQNGILTVLVKTNSPFELLYFTYFWWIATSNDISFSVFNIADGTHLAYPFVGIDGINNKDITYIGSGFNRKGVVSCSDSICPQLCVTNIVCQDLGGVVSGNNCIFCEPNSQWNGQSCVCIANYYQINGICSQCPANSVWNGNVCACLSGFNLVNGSCIVCPKLSFYIAQQQACICLSGYYMINGACTTCPLNSGWNGNECVCLSTFYLVEGFCQQMPPFSSYNGTAFVCLPNYYPINGVCSQCPSKSSWNGSGCVCNQRLYLIGGACIPCGPRESFNGSACVCDNGFNRINGVCQQCTRNSSWNGSACVCQNGFYPSGRNCLPCGPNSVWRSTASACVCSPGFFLINNICAKCSQNQAYNGSACVCVQEFYLINGVCRQCPSGTSWNGIACVLTCPSKSAWNGTACACIAGHFLIQGSCLSCDPNSSYDGKICNCNPGYFGNFQLCTRCDPSCATCSQAGVNSCTSCPNGLVLAQGTCGCGVGKALQGLICVNCPTNCISCSDDSTCIQCAANYNLVQQIVNRFSIIGCSLPLMGTPPKNPNVPDSKLALTGTTVGNNLIYQGVTLSSLPAYFLTTNCASCSDLFFVLIMPNTLGITYSIDYVLYSQYWFVITFSYGSSGITPSFQYKVQLNFKYANYFTPADMAQGVFRQVNSDSYPNPAIAANSGTFTSGSGSPSAPSAPIAPKPSTRPIITKSGSSTINSNALVSLFGK